MISVNIKINNFTVNFNSDILVKLSPRFAAELSPRFALIYPLFCINLLPGMHTTPM